MRFFLFALVSTTSLVGCVTHRDFLTSFRIQGVVALSDQTAEPQSNIMVELVDSGMDYVRSKDKPVFASFAVKPNQSFSVVQTYFWGTTKSNASQRAGLSIRVVADGCSVPELQYAFKDLRRQDHDLVVDLGAIRLQCGRSNK